MIVVSDTTPIRALKAEALHLAGRTSEALKAINEAESEGLQAAQRPSLAKAQNRLFSEFWSDFAALRTKGPAIGHPTEYRVYLRETITFPG